MTGEVKYIIPIFNIKQDVVGKQSSVDTRAKARFANWVMARFNVSRGRLN
jgi:hypothetical protein